MHRAILACEVLCESLQQGRIRAIVLRAWCFALPVQTNPKDTAQILHTLLHSECIYENT